MYSRTPYGPESIKLEKLLEQMVVMFGKLKERIFSIRSYPF